MDPGIRTILGLIATAAAVLVVAAALHSNPVHAMLAPQQATSTPAGTSTAMPTTTPGGTATATPIPLAASPVFSVAVIPAVHVKGGYAFSPKTMKVTVGSMVLWTNTTSHATTITSKTKSWKFNKRLSAHGTVKAIFSKAGTFQFYSKPHPAMVGKIIVVP